MTLLNDRNFELDVRTGVSVVKFHSLWNTDSRAFEDSFRQLSEEFRGKAKFIVSDINANSILAKREGITKVPTVVIYINGVAVAKITELTKRKVREQIGHFVQKQQFSV